MFTSLDHNKTTGERSASTACTSSKTVLSSQGHGPWVPWFPVLWPYDPYGAQTCAPGLAPSATWPWPGPAAAIVLPWPVAWHGNILLELMIHKKV